MADCIKFLLCQCGILRVSGTRENRISPDWAEPRLKRALMQSASLPQQTSILRPKPNSLSPEVVDRVLRRTIAASTLKSASQRRCFQLVFSVANVGLRTRQTTELIVVRLVGSLTLEHRLSERVIQQGFRLCNKGLSFDKGIDFHKDGFQGPIF
jgi:hypothetical protein